MQTLPVLPMLSDNELVLVGAGKSGGSTTIVQIVEIGNIVATGNSHVTVNIVEVSGGVQGAQSGSRHGHH